MEDTANTTQENDTVDFRDILLDTLQHLADGIQDLTEEIANATATATGISTSIRNTATTADVEDITNEKT